MKNFISLAVLIGLLVTSPLTRAAETAPDWALTSSEDETIRLSTELRQQPVILFFWATWCPYCKALMPHLQSMQLEYGDSIKILAINFREKGDPVGFIKEKGYDFTVLPNGDDVAALNDVYGTPGIIIVDGDQNVAFDLRELPPYDAPVTGKKVSHTRSAAFRAPYWAAAIRSKIDTVLKDSALTANSR
jgi:cytochrome c biogenesis protein CcmG/thiol:disulfide interchange protein DsbE